MTVEDRAIAWSYFVGAQEFRSMPFAVLKDLRPLANESLAGYRNRVIPAIRAGSTGDKG